MAIEDVKPLILEKPVRKLFKNSSRKSLGTFSSCRECAVFSLSKLEMKKFKDYCLDKNFSYCIINHQKNHYRITCEKFIYFSYLHSQQHF